MPDLLHIDIIMHDGSRQFADLPQTAGWYKLRKHIAKLNGASITNFVTDYITEAWMDFTFQGHSFSVNGQYGNYWFFVDDAECPDETLLTVLHHCEALLKT